MYLPGQEERVELKKPVSRLASIDTTRRIGSN